MLQSVEIQDYDSLLNLPYFINVLKIGFPIYFFDEWMLIWKQLWCLAKESMNSTEAITESGKIKTRDTIKTVTFIAYYGLQCYMQSVLPVLEWGNVQKIHLDFKRTKCITKCQMNKRPKPFAPTPQAIKTGGCTFL